MGAWGGSSFGVGYIKKMIRFVHLNLWIMGILIPFPVVSLKYFGISNFKEKGFT